jgi:superfamily II DNA or RNA helicase
MSASSLPTSQGSARPTAPPPPVLEALAALAPFRRDILVVLALSAAPSTTRKIWQHDVATAGVVDEDGQRLSADGFKAIIEHAITIGAAERTQGIYEYYVAERWLAPVLEDAHRRRTLRSITARLGAGTDYGVHARRLSRIGELRVALVTGEDVESAEQRYRARQALSQGPDGFIVDTLGLHAPAAWIARLAPDLRDPYLAHACHCAFKHAAQLGGGVREAALASESPEIRGRLATLLALAGDPSSLRTAHDVLARAGTSQWERSARAFAALTEGKIAEARTLFAEASIGSRKQRVELPAYLAAFDLLLSATSDDAAEVADVPRRIDRAKRQLYETFLVSFDLEDIVRLRQTGVTKGQRHDGHVGNTWLETAVSALRAAWTEQTTDAHRQKLTAYGAAARAAGYGWLANELERIAAGDAKSSLLSLLGKKAAWELALDALSTAATADSAATPKRGASELWWTVDLDRVDARLHVEGHHATKLSAKGKKLAITRALDDGKAPLRDEDRRVVDAYLAALDGYGFGYTRTDLSVLHALIGHPRVRDDRGRHLRIEAGEPSLHVTRTRAGATLTFVPSHFDSAGFAALRDGADRIVVYKKTAVASSVLAVLQNGKLTVPAEGIPRMSQVLAALGSSVRIEATGAIARDGGAADRRLRVQMFRAGEGLRARIRVVPGGDVGPALRPGQPPSEIMIGEGGELVRLTRDLAAEKTGYDDLLARCPTLASLPQEGDDRIAADLATCLELLIELREAAAAVVEWPAGQAVRAPSVRGASSIRVQVRGENKWLTIEGEMRVDESRVLEMRELLASASRAVGRFLPIGDDEYVALTDDLRAKLESLARVEGLGKDGRLPAALLPSMDGLLDGLDVTFAEELRARREAFERAQKVAPKTPRDLAAELRDYQREGFVFLVRRSEAGLGACLADDMGLGKTVQALALLLHRRKKGPALVVAPTSVCRNWENEARRFAPSLSVHRLAETDRATCVTEASAGDVVIVSYGLLASETELLASRTWTTVIYDEAHALKNATTRRWSAARDVKSDAVIALTGTPVENHAAELHALFELLVPGMLGSRSLFDAALGAKIAEGDRGAAALLRKLVRPFVLRRTKSEVLTELPPKTELLQVVAASAEHRAFYEAVRRRAVEKVDDARMAGKARAGKARIEVLAEIMRLRRAAIDPRLVGGEDAPEGSKLDALVELVLELRDEGRRALVFSQFLEVLDLARGRLEENGVECRRLDGTMTQGARAAEVDAFQGGKGDVFLVSLKAGGVGMNLTAADVVVLLDPWWNPAVEDQASARAHRIGQSRPVTVVRIVTEGTIEEKVLSLHAKKRQLFDDVVTGSDGGGAGGALDMETLATLLA